MEEETDQKTTIDPLYWEKLSKLHPTDVCNRTEAIYNPSRGGFILPVYNLRYLILQKTRRILKVSWNDQTTEEELHPFFYVMVILYLIEAKKEIQPTHILVSEKDLKGGFTFFQGHNSLQVKELEDLYGNNPQAFLQAGKRLGGSEILFGNKGFALDVFPKVPLAYLLWQGSEEFPPKVRVLFDSTIQSHVPLDVIWCIVAETSRRLAEFSHSE